MQTGAVALLLSAGLLVGGLPAIGFVGLSSTPACAAPVEEPSGYRMDKYRGPVPPTLQGARVVTTAELEVLWRSGEAVLLDVMPQQQKPADLPAGTVWRDPTRKDIPGSLWLANVGYGALTPEAVAYFRQSLEKVSQGAKDKPLVFYCMTDCWMSWNAAKRAIEWGYGTVLWYPPGADGWEKAKLPLAENRPYGMEN